MNHIGLVEPSTVTLRVSSVGYLPSDPISRTYFGSSAEGMLLLSGKNLYQPTKQVLEGEDTSYVLTSSLKNVEVYDIALFRGTGVLAVTVDSLTKSIISLYEYSSNEDRWQLHSTRRVQEVSDAHIEVISDTAFVIAYQEQNSQNIFVDFYDFESVDFYPYLSIQSSCTNFSKLRVFPFGNSIYEAYLDDLSIKYRLIDSESSQAPNYTTVTPLPNNESLDIGKAFILNGLPVFEVSGINSSSNSVHEFFAASGSTVAWVNTVFDLSVPQTGFPFCPAVIIRDVHRDSDVWVNAVFAVPYGSTYFNKSVANGGSMLQVSELDTSDYIDGLVNAGQYNSHGFDSVIHVSLVSGNKVSRVNISYDSTNDTYSLAEEFTLSLGLEEPITKAILIPFAGYDLEWNVDGGDFYLDDGSPFSTLVTEHTEFAIGTELRPIMSWGEYEPPTEDYPVLWTREVRGYQNGREFALDPVTVDLVEVPDRIVSVYGVSSDPETPPDLFSTFESFALPQLNEEKKYLWVRLQAQHQSTVTPYTRLVWSLKTVLGGIEPIYEYQYRDPSNPDPEDMILVQVGTEYPIFGNRVAISDPYFVTKESLITVSSYITIGTDDSSSTIYYTLDGSEPSPYSSTSFLYSGSFQIHEHGDYLIKAKSFSRYKSSSHTVSIMVKVMLGVVDSPSIIPTERIQVRDTLCTIVDNFALGSGIHYTTDGSTPTKDSLTYSGPFPISSTMYVKAVAFYENYISSSVVTQYYEVNLDSAPVISVSYYPDGYADVTIRYNPLYICRYSDSSAYIDVNCLQYLDTFRVNQDCTIYAQSFKKEGDVEYPISPISSEAISITIYAPQIHISALDDSYIYNTYYVKGFKLEIDWMAEGAYLFYTLDGSDPTDISNPSRVEYTAPVGVYFSSTVRAHLYKNGTVGADAEPRSATVMYDIPLFDQTNAQNGVVTDPNRILIRSNNEPVVRNGIQYPKIYYAVNLSEGQSITIDSSGVVTNGIEYPPGGIELSSISTQQFKISAVVLGATDTNPAIPSDMVSRTYERQAGSVEMSTDE